MGTDAGGIPSELLQAASEIPADRSSVVLEGPANCTDADARASDGAGDADVDDVEVQCAAALDGGLDSCGPLQIWDNVMKRYKVKQICEQELQRLDAISNKSEIDRVSQKLAEATAEAVEGISKLRHREVFKQLEEFKASQADSKEVLVVEHGEAFLRTSDPAFWCMCFMRLFPRGDCMERCVERGSRLSSQRWIKSLLSRADFTLWRKDVEFVATAFNIFLRREQMQAVEAFCRSPLFTQGQAVELEKLTATGLVSHALASGDVNSIKEVLKRKNLEAPITKALQTMQILQRNVRGSEGERDGILGRFSALRLWSGYSSLFFTLNPHDIRSPLTLLLLQGDQKWERRFSLDFTDEEAAEYMNGFLRENPRRLHQLVAQDQSFACRTFHWTVRLVIGELFNCADCPGGHADGVPARAQPGIFGHVRAYLGAVEPQMRKALHMHMLVQLVGYAHPDDMFRKADIAGTFKKYWLFAASICFRSTEAFAAHQNDDAAMEALRQLPLLPHSAKQRGQLGEERVRESVRAQKRGRGLSEEMPNVEKVEDMPFFSSALCADPTVNASTYAAAAVREVHYRTRKSGNHVCKTAVCHKGRIGKTGFCRMGFHHWSRWATKDGGFKAKRMHGLQLQRRWNRKGAPPIHSHPPHTGLPCLETTHQFHTKTTPGVLMGPQCNHDLGILHRLCEVPDDVDGLDETKIQEFHDTLCEVVGDHEYYSIACGNNSATASTRPPSKATVAADARARSAGGQSPRCFRSQPSVPIPAPRVSVLPDSPRRWRVRSLPMSARACC